MVIQFQHISVFISKPFVLPLNLFFLFCYYSYFILKHIEDSEFVYYTLVLKILNLLFFTSLSVSFSFLNTIALNKSRQLLSEDQLNSLPTVTQQFNDSFKGFTFIEKINNEIQNIFLHDNGKNLKNLSPNISNELNTIVKGIVKERKMFLFNGQIISSKSTNEETEVLKFEQLNIDLSDLQQQQLNNPNYKKPLP